MVYAKMGDTVKISYTGKLADGSIFDSAQEDKPIEFMVGEGKMLPAFEQALIGMVPGASKTKSIRAERAYGRRMSDLVQEFRRDDIPDHAILEIGQQLFLRLPGHGALAVTVVDIDDVSVTLDANHPLAGEDLIFAIRLLEIV